MLRKTIIKDVAFEGAGQVIGIEQWRIENLKPIKKSEVEVMIYTSSTDTNQFN